MASATSTSSGVHAHALAGYVGTAEYGESFITHSGNLIGSPTSVIARKSTRDAQPTQPSRRARPAKASAATNHTAGIQPIAAGIVAAAFAPPAAAYPIHKAS